MKSFYDEHGQPVDASATNAPFRWPVLRPNKPERLVVICPRCSSELAVGPNGAVAKCKCEAAK